MKKFKSINGYNEIGENKMKLRDVYEKNEYKIFIYCIFLSFAFLLICSKSSFLYPFNDWVDPNCFFTVGKGMVNGKVIYRDLFEQKGPLLYFIHALAYLISNNTFLGVYFFEVISFGIFLFFSYKIANLYLESSYSYFTLPILSLLILSSKAFVAGDSAEEFILPLLAISLYYMVKYYKEIYPRVISYKLLFINGVIAGAVLWIKYTMLGFWFAWMMFMFFSLILHKSFLRAIKSCGIFILGMITITLPWIIYFGINNAINDWIHTYFIINIFAYPKKMGFYERIIIILRSLKSAILLDKLVSFCLLIGVVTFILRRKFIPNFIGRLALFVSFILLILGVYSRGWGSRYYFLIFSAFAILGLIFILKLIDTKVHINNLLIVIGLGASITLSFYLSPNTYWIGNKKENLVQYKVAYIINETPNATLLNYGFLDGGFYTVADVIPNTKFFCKLNLPYKYFPEMMDEQNNIIKEKKVQYVIFNMSVNEDISKFNLPYILENYTQVLEVIDKDREGNDSTKYILYKVKA